MKNIRFANKEKYVQGTQQWIRHQKKGDITVKKN